MICLYKECERKVFSRGLCHYHYHWNWKNGTIEDVALPKKGRKRNRKPYRGVHMRKVYSQEEMDDTRRLLFKAQKGRCGICGKPGRKMVLDHDHETGKIRGLICHSCNTGLGLLGDTKEAITKALAYFD